MDAPTFMAAFQCLYNTPDISDVTLILPGHNSEDTDRKIYAHKTILAAGSREFREHFATCVEDDERESKTEGDSESEDDIVGSGYDVEIEDIYQLDSPDYYVPMLRYLYGLPLCAEDEHIGALALEGMCDAAKGFDIPHLRQHALSKLEELLRGHLSVEGVRPADGEPLPSGYLDTNLGAFLFELEALLTSDDEANFDEDTYSDAMQVAVKVCCEHLETLRQFSEFHDRCPSKLYRSMLFYHGSHGCTLQNSSANSEHDE